MNSSTLRRLAADHASLHKADLPPYYLFPPPSSAMPDDLTQLTVLLTGPEGTPYSTGVWKLHLKIPQDYPKSPPKASFRTKIWHPNVEESTGSVCVDTLKRDWSPKLTLRDILITISCLLIQPNPDSALNASAGKLLQEDFESFSRHARLMTSIHAAIPANLSSAAAAARSRGEDKPASKASMTNPTRKRPHLALETPSLPVAALSNPYDSESDSDYDSEDPDSASKENNPSLSPSPVAQPQAPAQRRPTLQKRPLSDLPTPLDSDDSEAEELTTCSTRNIAANTPNLSSTLSTMAVSGLGPQRSTKLVERSRGACLTPRSSSSSGLSAPPVYGPATFITPFEDSPEYCPAQNHAEKRQREVSQPPRKRLCSSDEDEDGKENASQDTTAEFADKSKVTTVAGAKAPALVGLGLNTVAAAPRKVTTGTIGKAKGRMGLRRL